MKVINEFLNWINSTGQILAESKGHMDHPEDMVILGGLPGYKDVSSTLSVMAAAAANPKGITIKFDGYPAIVFGSGPDGKFGIYDKHMFNRGVNRPQITSPQQFAEYEAARGEKGRTGLVELVKKIWPALERSYSGKGWYMGDILFDSPLKDDGGLYKFRPNPNGILYQVDVGSDLGKYLSNKTAGIAVHRYLAPEAQTTEDMVTWLTDLGGLSGDGSVALLPVSMPITPKIKLNSSLKSKAEAANNSAGQIYEFIQNAPQNASTFANLFTVYINSKIVSGNLSNMYTDFMPWVKQRLDGQLAGKKISSKMHGALIDYLEKNASTVRQLFKNWIDIHNYKMDIVDQINIAASRSPIKGYLQSGQESQEGFVYGGLKFVDRAGFSRQNLGAKIKEAKSPAKRDKKVLVVYPGGFHPFHLGHGSVYSHLASKFSDGDVFVAATDTTTERPFQFSHKKFLASQNGVPSNKFIQVKSPYRAQEITTVYDPENTILVFAVSEKDSDRFNYGNKKDGTPSYFQPYTDSANDPMKEHAYIYVVPKIDFRVGGQVVDSASKIRAMYAAGDDDLRTRIVSDLYPNATNPGKIKNILDSVLGGLTEADNPDYFGGSSASPIPGTPSDLQPAPSQEEIESYQKQMVDLKKFLGHKN